MSDQVPISTQECKAQSTEVSITSPAEVGEETTIKGSIVLANDTAHKPQFEEFSPKVNSIEKLSDTFIDDEEKEIEAKVMQILKNYDEAEQLKSKQQNLRFQTSQEYEQSELYQKRAQEIIQENNDMRERYKSACEKEAEVEIHYMALLQHSLIKAGKKQNDKVKSHEEK